jgi:hypothetical protein
MTITVDAGSGPRNAFIQAGTGLRYYTWQGRAVPSVTSIRNMAGQPHALVSWKIAKVCDRAVDELDVLVAMLNREPRPRERVLDKNRRKEARAWLRAAHEEERDRAASRGTAVHLAAEHGETPETVTDYTDPETGVVIPAEEIRPKLRQYLAWMDDSGAVPVLRERQVWNLTLGYAGSFDLMVRFPNGELWIVDLKTGGTYSDHVLQQVAYLMAEFIGQDDVVDEDATTLLHQVAGIALLHLQDDGWTFIRPVADPAAWDAFRGLLSFATWTRDHADESSFTVAARSGAAPSHEPATTPVRGVAPATGDRLEVAPPSSRHPETHAPGVTSTVRQPGSEGVSAVHPPAPSPSAEPVRGGGSALPRGDTSLRFRGVR